MTWMDDRGRLFGKLNLIDALGLVFCCWLIPLTYGAYQLFRMPPVSILSVVPKQIIAGKEQRVIVNGDQLRPYLVASVGDVRVTYRSENIERAELALPDKLPVGDYALTLYDEVNPIARLENAIQVVPPPVVPEPLPAHPLIMYRPKWLTRSLSWGNAQAQLDAIEHDGWQFYTLMPCADKLCVVAHKSVYGPAVRR